MRIHIVTRDHTSNQILARLAGALAQHAAFSVGPTPDDRADLNYFFPYLERLRFPVFNQTPVAAWFTHKDLDRPEKVEMWNDTVVTIDLALTCAQGYYNELSESGATAMVVPPLDRDHFAPGKRAQQDRRVIGTSGMVYPGGRKGEQLFKRLVDSLPECDFVASGSGWAVPTSMRQWEDMPEFYRALDVYVCTSTIEGIGYGPLEAMACGIPVVLPRGVGVFDDLPDLENLHRYQAGDYADLSRAVREALSRLDENGYNPQSLRGATARFTLEAWHDSHLRAFERLLYDVPSYKPQYAWQGKAGVYYVAFGQPARECAVRAIKSFKQYMPDVPIAIVSDTPLNAGEDVFIQHEDSDIGGRSVKTQIYDLAPQGWDYVLYLDADTELVAPIPFLFDVLEDGWSMVICTNPGKYVTIAEMRRPDNGEEVDATFKMLQCEELLQLNGGVFAFARNPNTERFFHDWHTEWGRWAARDQAALLRALHAHPIRVYVVGNEWNTVTRYLPAEITAGILHYPMQARRWRGRINGRLDSSEAWAAVHPSKKVNA